MKKLFTVWFILVLSSIAFAGPPIQKSVSDEAYNATTWNGVKSTAPSKNAVRDKLEAFDSAIDWTSDQGATNIHSGNYPITDGLVPDDITLTNISQITTKPITSLSATNWRLFYSADGAIPVELVLGADGTFLESNGASSAPAFRVLASGDIPDISATYLTLAQIGAAYDTEAELLALFAAKCDESVFGDAKEANHFKLVGTTFTLTDEVALHDEANTWTEVQALKLSRLTAQTSEPTDEAVFDIIRADCDTWDPLSVGGTTDYFVICTAAGSPGTYSGFIKADGKLMVSSITTPTLLAAELNDTSDPHTLIQREMEGKIISNASAAMHLDVLAEAEGWSVIFHVGAANNFVVHPNDSADWYLNGTVLAADRTISNTAPTIGEDLACYSTGGKVFCKSTFADWVSASE